MRIDFGLHFFPDTTEAEKSPADCYRDFHRDGIDDSFVEIVMPVASSWFDAQDLRKCKSEH
jgi:hypothetical protein